ncbi:MAG: prepilin-type N-terminal cleavage/methylation domain-containing protein [Candidatus Kaiserbacteria bacterium]|nr:prepilin-type N-terminal cleavage/methylation domain-containing protein [Candidatus Kaiserbacteria bacterium]
MYIYSTSRNGFTLIEILLVMAIMLILVSVSTVSLTQVQQYSYLSKSLELLLSDIKLQQAKAMNGVTDTGTPYRYGMYFGQTSYTLFRGDTYDPADSTNFTVTLDGQLSFAGTGFTDDQFIFDTGSGEISGFVDGQNTITIANPGSATDTVIELNNYGIFTQIN